MDTIDDELQAYFVERTLQSHAHTFTSCLMHAIAMGVSDSERH